MLSERGSGEGGRTHCGYRLGRDRGKARRKSGMDMLEGVRGDTSV